MNFDRVKDVPGNDYVHFQQLIEDSPVASYICDANGKLTYYNKAASVLWGRSPILGKESWCGCWKIYYEDGTPMPLEDSPMAKTLKTGQAYENAGIRIERPDGTFKSLLLFPKPLFDTDGRLRGAHNTLVDVTDRQKDHIRHATLSAIVESSDDAIISKDLNGTINSWNSGAERIFGYTEKEVLGKPITILIPRDRLHEEENIISNIKAGRRVDHIDTLRLDKEGREIPISVTVSPVKDAFGKIIGASKVARDISERLLNEEKQAILSAIVESSDDAIISKDLNGTIMSWNRGAEEIFGYSEEEVLGRSIKILIPKERLPEEDVILGRISTGKKVDHFETVRKRKDGKRIYVSITVSPVKDRRGTIIGASKVARDITLQVESQAAMESYIRNLETLNTVGKSISENLDVQKILQRVTDATGLLTGAHFAAFFYNNIDEEGNNFQLFTLSETSKDLYKDYEISRFTEIFRPSFIENKVLRVEDITRLHNTSNINENKSLLPVMSYLSVPVVGKSGAVIGGLLYTHPEPGKFTAEHELMVVNLAGQAAISLDNSKLFEQVKCLSDKKDEFIALASHELKTPLTTIKGYLQVLAQMEKDPTSHLFLNKSLYQVDKLNTLVEDLLNMSRIEAGRLNFNLETFDLRELLKEILETFIYSSQTHSVVTNLGDSPAYIKGDKQRIEQAVLNLLTNAIKYSPKADSIYVNLEVKDGKVITRVKDEGIGLTGEQKENLFTRFYRAENTGGISGLGLGLYLTKQIITRHRGSIDVNSEFGKGSEFYFSLPMKKENVKEETTVQSN